LPGDRPPQQAAATISGEGNVLPVQAEVVSLNEVANQVGVTVAEQIALQDAALRKWMTYWTIGTFIGANVVTLAAVAVLVWLDQSNLQSDLITPVDRIITDQVIMTLLGATTVQVGAIAYAIARYLSPDRSRGR
jgi:hypothetical protein